MNIEKFLDMLTPEQLEALAQLKREENGEKKEVSKRKQTRKPKVVDNKPRKKTTERSTLDKNLKRGKGNAARKTGPLELGERPNKFIGSQDFNAYKENEEIAKILYGDKKPTERTRQVEMVDAICTQCEEEYENVPVSICYKDGSDFVFVCNECERKYHKCSH